MDKLLERFTLLKDAVFQEWIDNSEKLPEGILDGLYSAYQQLDIVCIEVLKLRKQEEINATEGLR